MYCYIKGELVDLRSKRNICARKKGRGWFILLQEYIMQGHSRVTGRRVGKKTKFLRHHLHFSLISYLDRKQKWLKNAVLNFILFTKIRKIKELRKKCCIF